ncbi:MAG: NUDIX domain-containing protein [Vicinamibacterales bacterium]
MSVATPRPASTVVVLRAADPAFEVLMVRRNDQVAFMAGAYVFPGGRVDDADRAVTPPADARAARFDDLDAAAEWPYRVAASRELAEEANVRVPPSDLVPIAHWVTPEIEIRRYDTRFFLTVMPEGQSPRHDAGETTALEWLAPHDAIARCRAGDIQLPPPTWTTLRRLERFATLAAALDWARTTPIARVMPGFVRGEAGTVLTLPGDPSYPAMPGWEVPEDTRFLLEEGRGWRPIPA